MSGCSSCGLLSALQYLLSAPMQSYASHGFVDGSSATPQQKQTAATPTTPPPSSLGCVHQTRLPAPPASALRGSLPDFVTAAGVPAPEKDARKEHSSSTWTTSSGGADLFDDVEGLEDRSIFVHEYNRLAKKVGSQTPSLTRAALLPDFGLIQSAAWGPSPGARRLWHSSGQYSRPHITDTKPSHHNNQLRAAEVCKASGEAGFPARSADTRRARRVADRQARRRRSANKASVRLQANR